MYEWIPVLFLLVLGGMILLPGLLLGLFRETYIDKVGREVLGNKYRHLVKLKVSDCDPMAPGFILDLLGFLLFGNILGSVSAYGARRLWHLLQEDRKRAIQEIHLILILKGEKVPDEAWREFYRRNPEARDLWCPVSLPKE